MELSRVNSIGIVGATSGLGVSLVRLLSQFGNNIHVGYRHRDRILEAWRADKSITCHQIDMDAPESLQAVCKETLVWLAHREQGRFNENEVELNLRPFEAALKSAHRFGVRKAILISSGGSVYGEPLTLPISEDHQLVPLSSYGKAKKALEQRLFLYGALSDLDVSVIRPSNIYNTGPLSERSKGVINSFQNSLHNGEPFMLLGEGKSVRDFIHVDDVSRAIVCAIQSARNEIIWNVGTSVGHSIADILGMILSATGRKKPEILHLPSFSTDVSRNVLSIERIRKESGWRPQITIEEGIARLAANL